MRLEQGIKAAIVALSPTVRVYYELMPQGVTYPAVTFQRISTVRGETLTAIDTLTQVRVQFDVWSSTVASGQAISDQLRDLLDGHTGDLGGVTVQYARLENENTGFTADGDRETRRISMDFMFMLHE